MLILSWLVVDIKLFKCFSSFKPYGDLHRVELVAAMPALRYCDFCLQPYVGNGDLPTCTLACPSRRGAIRGYVIDELRFGHIQEGLHPRSPLITQARTGESYFEFSNK